MARTERAAGIIGILDALEQAVESARGMPMSSSVLVSRAELLDLVAQARAALPSQLTRADQLLSSADDVVARSQTEAEQLLAEARRRAAEMVSSEQIVVAAQARAAEIIAEVEQVAEGLRREADDYADRRLADFEIDLGRLLAQIQAGRAKLAGRLAGEGRLGGPEPMP
jgi:vacuolar-type H+-ATPase subunit H